MLYGVQKMNKPLSFDIHSKRRRTRMRRLLEPGYRFLTVLLALIAIILF